MITKFISSNVINIKHITLHFGKKIIIIRAISKLHILLQDQVQLQHAIQGCSPSIHLEQVSKVTTESPLPFGNSAQDMAEFEVATGPYTLGTLINNTK